MKKREVESIIVLLILLFAVAFMATAEGQVQLMPTAKLAACRAMLPQVEDVDWQAFLSDSTTLFYSDAEMPGAFQHNMGGDSQPITTFHEPRYNFSGDAGEAPKGHGNGGNGNVEFPWKKPGGTDAAGNRVSSFKLLWLPKRDDGTPWPVVTWNEHVNTAHSPHQVYRWTYPRGTIFGEVLTQKDSRGTDHVFEIRLRVRAEDYWDIDILRPFPTSADYRAALARQDPTAADRFARRTSLVKETFVDRTHDKPGFVATAASDWIPPLREDQAAELLRKTPFKSTVGRVWAEQPDGTPSFAPTTDQAFHIVPVGYRGTLLGTSNESCIKCHESTLKHVTEFSMFRGWYGHIRGDDGIFTFHPIAIESIGTGGNSYPVSFRRELVNAGMVARFDPSRHQSSRYRQLARSK